MLCHFHLARFQFVFVQLQVPISKQMKFAFSVFLLLHFVIPVFVLLQLFIASSLFVPLKVLLLSYCKFCICTIEILSPCTIANLVFVQLQVLHLYYCKFSRSTIASSVFVLLQVLYLYYWKYKILDLNPWRRASASPLIQLFTKSLGTPRRFSIVTFLCMYCIEVSKLLNLSKQKY